VACDTCGLWYHARCQSIPTLSYDNLHSVNVKWYCAVCGNPNSETVFDLHGVDWPDSSNTPDVDLSNNSCATPTEQNFHPTHASTPTRANQQDKRMNRPLRVLNINFQSCVGKKAETSCLIDSMKPDIILASETWLKKEHSDNEVLPDTYKMYRKDRTSKGGGGIFIAVRSDLNSYIVPELSTDCEIIWVAVKLAGRKTLYLCSYYRPHVSDEISLIKLGESLERVSRIPNGLLLLGGDFNFPNWDWHTMTLKPCATYTGLHNLFIDMLHDNGLEQLVMEPTRQGNTLDLLLTNNPELVARTEVIPGISDHCIPYCELSTRATKIKQKPRKIPLYNDADWEGMKEPLRNLHNDMTKEQNGLSTEELWSRFKETLTDATTACIRHKVSRTKTSKPWITPEIRKLIKRQSRVYKKMKKSGTPELKEQSKQLKRLIQRKTRQVYWQYVSKAITPEENSPDRSGSLKRFWTFIKHQKASNTGVSPLKCNGQLVTDPKEQAEVLNNQFQSVFGDGQEYTPEEFHTKCQMSDNTPTDKLSDIIISEEGVRKLLLNLNPFKASGPDGISARVLKELADEVAPLLTIIFNSSLNTGEVPSDWRSAHIAPIFKKGEHYDPSNYRPVSLTCISCKIMEHVIVSELMSHLENNNILRPEQHGFRKARSCETQLLDFTEELFDTMENGKQSDIIIMDFSKAFDRVNHSLLLHKLHHYGVQDKVNRWIGAFLHGRQQAVVVNGEISAYVGVKSGVPQGSVMGPALFLAYINDLPEGLSSPTRLFADDTAVYRQSATEYDQQQLQSDLQQLERWEGNWDMAFHPGKCIALPVTRKRKVVLPEYKLHEHTLAAVTSAKYLGVTITQDLSWDLHISNICAKANQTLGFLRRNLKISSTAVKETAYKTFVRPILEYACTVWDPFTEKNINKIESVQRRAARFASNRYHNTSSVTDMLEKLGWPSLQHRRKVARLAMLHKILSNEAIVDKKKVIPAMVRQRRGHSQQLKLIQSRTQYRQSSFLPKTIKEWNKLPESAMTAGTLDTFKSRVPLE